MPCCVVLGCSTRQNDKTVSPPITLHQFPLDEEQKEKWILAVNRENWMPSKRSYLCSKHFTQDCFDRSEFYSKLKKGAIPSIFDSYHKPKFTQDCANDVESLSNESVEPEPSTSGTCSEPRFDNQEFILSELPRAAGQIVSTHRGSPHRSVQSPKPVKIRIEESASEVPVKRPASGDDRYDLLGKTIALRMRGMEKRQRLLAEKLVNDILFEGEMGILSSGSFHSSAMYLQHQATATYSDSSSSPSSPPYT